MRIGIVQAVLSLLVIGAFVVTSSAIALYPPLTEQGEEVYDRYTEHLKTFVSLYSGLTGVILGYYFGRRGDDRSSEKPKVTETDPPTREGE